MSVHEKPELNLKQVATNEMSAAARLDRPAEDPLYRLYRSYFQTAEETRRWNLWEDIPWDQVRTDPPSELVEAVLAVYREDVFLPDYSARALHVLRSSRGRAWFLTRWSYEEGKHLLALTEWLIKSGARTDAELKQLSNGLLAQYTWEPPFNDGAAVFADSLLWELRELEQGRALRLQAQKAEDPALVAVLDYILADEEAHLDFFRAALSIIAREQKEAVEDAVRRIAEVQEFPGGAPALLAALALPTD